MSGAVTALSAMVATVFDKSIMAAAAARPLRGFRRSHIKCCVAAAAQVAFKGYEEARVALTCLLFTIPCCIIIGVEYGVFMNGKLRVSLKVSAHCCHGAAAAARAQH